MSLRTLDVILNTVSADLGTFLRTIDCSSRGKERSLLSEGLAVTARGDFLGFVFFAMVEYRSLFRS